MELDEVCSFKLVGLARGIRQSLIREEHIARVLADNLVHAFSQVLPKAHVQSGDQIELRDAEPVFWGSSSWNSCSQMVDI